MPETKLQEVVFALLMSFFMVLGMEFYNGSIQMGEWTRAVFPIMFGEMRFMLPLCFATSYFVMDKIAQKLMLRLVTPGQDKPILVVLVRSGITVSLMCPAMSFWATLIFQGIRSFMLPAAISTVVMSVVYLAVTVILAKKYTSIQ